MPGVFAKEFRIRRKQAGIEDLQNARKINLRVFRIRMIALNEKCDGGQQEQASNMFDIQSVLIHFSMSKKNYTRKYLWQEAGERL